MSERRRPKGGPGERREFRLWLRDKILTEAKGAHLVGWTTPGPITYEEFSKFAQEAMK